MVPSLCTGFLVCFGFLKKSSFLYAINVRTEPSHSCWPQREEKENPGESAHCTPTCRKPQRCQGTIHTIKFFAGTKAPSLHSHSLLNQQSCKSYFYRHLFSLSHKIVWKHFPNNPVAIVPLTPPPRTALLHSYGPCHWMYQCCLTAFLLLWKPGHRPKLSQRHWSVFSVHSLRGDTTDLFSYVLQKSFPTHCNKILSFSPY